MDEKVQVNRIESGNYQKKYKRIKLLLFSEDFDFAQSFSLYFRKDYQKIITVNDEEILLQIVSTIKPEIIIIDNVLNESLINLIIQLKLKSSSSKIFVFTSSSINQLNVAKKLNQVVDKIFYQPIDLLDFNQLLNYYTGD